MNELNKTVCELMGFKLSVLSHNGGEVYHLVDSKGCPYFEGNKYEIASAFTDPDRAWAQAPTLDALMLPLIAAMRHITHANLSILFPDDGGFDLILFTSGDALYAVNPTLPEAIATLFIAASEAGEINPKDVVL